MKLIEIAKRNNYITVHVDDEFSELSFDFEFDDSWEELSQVPDSLTPIVAVITPNDNDYRGMGGGSNMESYSSSPELLYYSSASGSCYQQDLLNEPNMVCRLFMSVQQLQSLIQKHTVETSNGMKTH